jgi:bifunctional non-homologous end joining protein LigD
MSSDVGSVESSRSFVPRHRNEAMLAAGSRHVRLTNLRKVLWPALGITKGMLVQYYLDVAPVLLPHLQGRALVAKRRPGGAAGEFFWMRRVPTPRPSWIATCALATSAGAALDLPVIDDALALAWLVNLDCIDIHPWVARRDDLRRPDSIGFALDASGDRPFEDVRTTALALRDWLERAGAEAHVKTNGSAGLDVCVPIVRGPTSEEVGEAAQRMVDAFGRSQPRRAPARAMLAGPPAGCAVSGRPTVDGSANTGGAPLASAYSVHPTPLASVSMPLTWVEVEEGALPEDFRIDNAAARIRSRGDLWAPLAPEAPGRFDLARFDLRAITCG